MNICFFGDYDVNYSRNKILISGLNLNNVKVYHCFAKGIIISRYLSLCIQFIKIRKIIKVIFVPQVCQRDMPLAWILSKVFSKKLVFDMFFSMYETYVFDRKSVKINSFMSKFIIFGIRCHYVYRI